MSTSTEPVVVEAAGALVWRVRLSRLQVALVHRPRYHDWSWPKGKLDPGESAVGAAIREVAEETGHEVVLGIPLPGLEYRISDGRTKRVHYWAAQVAGRRDATALRARPPVPRASRTEIDQVRWWDVETAVHRLTNKDDRLPLDALVQAYEKGRLDTRAVVIARHGSARRRAGWTGSELDRPLTREGERQASALVPVLSAFGVSRLATSEWARCRSTITPYSIATTTTPQVLAMLTEAEHERSPARVASAVVELLRSSGDSVLCTHRPVLPTVVDVLAQHARRAVADQLPAHDPFLHPGQLLVAHVAQTTKGPRVVAAETHRPPAE
ncbi:NUDIX hydrolase [Cellulomonas soli]|uniref:ADP-ribose pyrophosphatase n=1 Tax=Cellulomonas soli TaxID=931535 RepID=A0A512PGH3_9CELL|nr:NUDIX hydrolase [Cellulomonas soli]NYI58150.1 8-oxo-dGTP diphosphatase [Cellulomonas soli]GEP70283.1 ADP-ribose pyrophosphatase [Cellulomonas soli]